MKQSRRSLFVSLLAACVVPFVGRQAKATMGDTIRDVTSRVLANPSTESASITLPMEVMKRVSIDAVELEKGKWLKTVVTRAYRKDGSEYIESFTRTVVFSERCPAPWPIRLTNA